MIGKKLILSMVLCIGALLMAACDGQGQGQPSSTPIPTPLAPTAPSTLTPQTTTVPTTTAQATSVASSTAKPTAPVGWNAKVTYQVTGGIAGVKRTLMIGPSGQARLVEGSKNPGPVRLTVERLARIKSKLDVSDFFNLKDRYGEGNVADDFILTLSLTQGDRTKTVVVEQIGGKRVAPQALVDFIAELDALQQELQVNRAPSGTPPASASPTSATPATPGSFMLTYQINGGYPPFYKKMQIGAMGEVTYSYNVNPMKTPEPRPKLPAQLSQERVAQMQAKLNAVRFFEMKEHYGKGDVHDDVYTTVTVTQGGRTKYVTVERYGGKGVTPQPVLDLMTALDAVENEVWAQVAHRPLYHLKGKAMAQH